MLIVDADSLYIFCNTFDKRDLKIKKQLKTSQKEKIT